MNRETLIEAVRVQMPAQRWQHTLGVMETSVILAERFGADPERAELAAILHDYAKYWPVERMREIIERKGLSRELLAYGKELWHAPVGAWAAEHELGVADGEVLDAVRYHTSGRPGMTLLEKIVCLADYMEPGRDFPGVEDIRRLAEHHLEAALVAGFDSTIRFLLDKGRTVYPLTVMARNTLLDEIGERNDQG